MRDPNAALDRLEAVVARLRAPDGCPWDREQTHQTLTRYLLEECFEAADALQRGDDRAACDELGDVLWNVVLHAQLAKERGAYDLRAIAAAASDKLVRRHPHVFGDGTARDASAAREGWEEQKRREKQERGEASSTLAGIPVALPALLRALRIGEKAASVGFDWPSAEGPREKLDEELRELDEAMQSGDRAAMAAELGDLLFSACNLARKLSLDPEAALRGTVDRFARRFAFVEQELGPDLKGQPLEVLEASWQRAKRALADGGTPPGAGAPTPD